METTFWICDTCGRKINDIQDGWVEWRKNSDGTWDGLRLVHHNATNNNEGCQYPVGNQVYSILDLPLSEFVGDYGLMELLSLLSEGKLPKEEVLEMIKRIHISGYEKARLRIKDAISQGVFEPNSHPGIYTESQIELVNQWINEGN